MELEQADVVAQYESGIDAVKMITASFDEDDWKTPVCGKWTAVETIRHLAGVVGWYGEWLDRALAGDSSAPFGADEFGSRNDGLVVEHAGLSGPEAADVFAQTARAYGDRVIENWGMAYGFPLGTVTAGLHLGIAATEWHLHAWDVSALVVVRHEPDDSARLFLAAGMAMAEARGGWRGAGLRLLVPVGARIRPWQTLLKESGRKA